MKAISLWQPWASAIAEGGKTIETRSWATKYRGRIAIHAALRRPVYEMIHYGCCWNWCGALNRRMEGGAIALQLPFGAIIATAEIVDCAPTDSFTNGEMDAICRRDWDKAGNYCWTQRQMGDFSLGRFGWRLRNVEKLQEPIPFRGRQQMFEVPL